MEREKVQDKYKWNVKDIFESDEKWEKAAEELNSELDFSAYQGKLCDKATLLKYLKENDEISIRLELIAVYANLKRDEDTRKTKYNSYSGKIDMIFSRYCAATAFFEPEMAAMDETYLKELIADEAFSDYDYQLKLLLKRRSHVLSEKEERLIALSSETLGTFSDIFAMIDNADLALPEIEWEGEKRKLTHVDRKVYENLLESVTENCGVMHRYIADRKKILGVDKLHFYDIYAPLVGDVEVKMSYDEAYEYVIEGLAALGKDYQKLLERGYEERWIDVEETEGKRNGAYSAGVYGVHPYVLLNYQPTLNDVFTIAHEMGHSLHTYFSQKNQPYAKSSYKIFVAEVAFKVYAFKGGGCKSEEISFQLLS